MNSLKYINSILRNENTLVVIIKRSEPDFWGYTTIGHLAYVLGKKKDCLIITEKEILYLIRSKLKKKVKYLDFSEIRFNHMNDNMYYKDAGNNEQSIKLDELRITYEEIQYLKSKLN
ncbi:hypothetical protein [Winogradskyella sp. PE311]|uniref:hypothetical protein n=1 Tax=Winogradskyella sp. PE311 TaxID=3366943 RepID=UPI00397ECEE6